MTGKSAAEQLNNYYYHQPYHSYQVPVPATVVASLASTRYQVLDLVPH